jgi:hypothetical protein
MAQTKRKRQTKHRGNAAGVVESRGRTGRKPTSAEKSGPQQAAKRKTPIDKRDQPPTWRSAFYKAMIASVLLLVVVIVLLHGSPGAISLFPIVVGGYTLVSYYTDKWVYERRQRKKRQGKAQSR